MRQNKLIVSLFIVVGLLTLLVYLPETPTSAVEEIKGPVTPASAAPTQKPRDGEKPTIVSNPRAENRRALKDFMAVSFQGLPTLDDVEADDDRDPHAPPKAIFRATEILGEIRERLSHSTRAGLADVADFYDRCAKKENIIVSVRALCYRNLLDLKGVKGNPLTVNPALYPAHIRRIGERLPHVPFNLE